MRGGPDRPGYAIARLPRGWIERLVEPLPAPEIARAYPEGDAKLRTEPGFLVFRLVKDDP